MKRPYKHIDLEDMFSDFEHTPNDSNWNNISGGLNSRAQSGNLSDKFSDFDVTPSSQVWKSVSAVQHPNRRKRLAAFWWTGSSVVASLLAVMFFLPFGSNSDLAQDSDYSPRSGGSALVNTSLHSDTDQSDLLNLNSETFSFVELYEESQAEVTSRDFIPLNQEDYTATNSGFNKLVHMPNASDQKSSRTHDLAQVEQYENPLSSAEDSVIKVTVNKWLTEEDLAEFELFKMTLRSSDLLTTAEFITDLGNKIPLWIPYYKASRPTLNDRGTEFLASSQLNESTGSLWNSAHNQDEGLSTNSTTSDQESVSDLTFSESIQEVGQYGFSSKEDFKTPVYITLQLEKPVYTGYKERVRIGFGLGILVMNSTLREDFSGLQSEQNIRRTYMAIPLYLKYNMINKKKWNLYTSTGITSELGVGGKITSNDLQFFSNTGGTTSNTTSTKFSLGLGQFNANLGFGADVKFGKHIRGFAEASLSHYFHESQYTFWSNQRFWPSLKTGVSLNF